MKRTEIYLPIIVALCASLSYRGGNVSENGLES